MTAGSTVTDEQLPDYSSVLADHAYPIGASLRERPRPIVPHTHDFCEIAIVASGSALHRCQDGIVPVGPGRVIAIRPGAWHAFDDPDRLSLLNLCFAADLLLDDLAWSLESPVLSTLLLRGGISEEVLSPAQLHDVRGWFDQLAALPIARPVSTSTMILQRSLLGCILGHLSTLTVAGSPSAQISAPVHAAMTMITADLRRPWNLTDIASGVALSPSALQRRFKTETGLTPLHWLARARAEQFAVQLVASDDTVAAIGTRVGWPDPNYASRRFRQLHGCSPTEFRRAFSP